MSGRIGGRCMARITIADLDPRAAPPDAAGGRDIAALLGAIDPNTPLDKALGLEPGDTVRIAGGKGRIVRASGKLEPIHLPATRDVWDYKFVQYVRSDQSGAHLGD